MTSNTISTGNENLNAILGGGWPIGPGSWQPHGLSSERQSYPAARIAEIFGAADAGCAAVACLTVAAALEAGKRVLLIDCAASPIDWRALLSAAMHRVCTESRQSQIKLADLCNDPETALSVLEAQNDPRAKRADLIVLSTACFAPSNLARNVSLDQRRLNNTLRKVASWQRNVCVLIVSEQCNPAAVDFGQPSTSTSGNAAKFYSWTRLQLRKLGSTGAGRKVVKAKVVKAKPPAAPFGSCELEICDGVLQP